MQAENPVSPLGRVVSHVRFYSCSKDNFWKAVVPLVSLENVPATTMKETVELGGWCLLISVQKVTDVTLDRPKAWAGAQKHNEVLAMIDF